MKKPHVSRTYGQIHFEDLEPKRFEDLVRELIYDYKDWQNLEATGRSGDDDGFDIRAFEKGARETVTETDEDEEVESTKTVEGNLWMIQCKREKAIGPTKVKKILEDVDEKNPPYGYILAASANFSKESYDTFRAELQKKGVMEFHLWGKAELEDMLHQPKNDRILFTFFGLSLVSKRKSRATEIRSRVINKNKVLRIFGDPLQEQSVLIRDSFDTKYPYKESYKDFKENPRWKEYRTHDYYPLGLIVNMYRYFAYVDHQKKEYDYSEIVSLGYKQSNSDEENNIQREAENSVEAFWQHLPLANQAHFVRDGLLKYDEMLVIDDKGDNWHKFPHIFTSFELGGPFAGIGEYFEQGRSQKKN